MGVSKKDYPEPKLNDDAYAQPLGFLIVYVDDVLCTGTRKFREEQFLPKLKAQFTIS